MHEWALAEGIISAAEAIYKEKDFINITKIKVRIGKLQRAEEKILKRALKDLAESKDFFKDLKIRIEPETAVLKCRNCGNTWCFSESKDELKEGELEAIHFLPETVHSYLRCPECGSSDYKVKKGRGIWIQYIKGEK